MTECNCYKFFYIISSTILQVSDFGIKPNKQYIYIYIFQESVNIIMKSYVVAKTEIILLVNKTICGQFQDFFLLFYVKHL